MTKIRTDTCFISICLTPQVYCNTQICLVFSRAFYDWYIVHTWIPHDFCIFIRLVQDTFILHTEPFNVHLKRHSQMFVWEICELDFLPPRNVAKYSQDPKNGWGLSIACCFWLARRRIHWTEPYLKSLCWGTKEAYLTLAAKTVGRRLTFFFDGCIII